MHIVSALFFTLAQGSGGSDSTFAGDIACASSNPSAIAILSFQLPEAIGTISMFDAAAAIEIQQAIDAGSVAIVPLDATTGGGLAGAADANTVGLDADLADAELAAALYHEWHHVRQTRPADQGGLPAEALLSASCREACAYAADFQFVCLMVAHAQADGDEPPFECSYIKGTFLQLFLERLKCLLGTPGAPVPPLPTPCTGYCS